MDYLSKIATLVPNISRHYEFKIQEKRNEFLPSKMRKSYQVCINCDCNYNYPKLLQSLPLPSPFWSNYYCQFAGCRYNALFWEWFSCKCLHPSTVRVEKLQL